jgi:spore coat protein U-like protein
LLTGSNGGVLNWELFQGTDCTGNVFGDTNDANEAAGTDTAGGVEDINIAACLLSNPIPQVPGGTYTETVTMTLEYT